MSFLQQEPIVVEVIKQPQPTQDISIDYIITMFQTAGIFLLAAALGGIIVGAIFIGIRRLRRALYCVASFGDADFNDC
jgi:hypothetical protein